MDSAEYINENYDAAFKKCKHFQLHPLLLPFVGKKYDENKILLIGESHYLEDGDCELDFAGWYEKCDDAFPIKSKSNYNTREVVSSRMSNKRSNHADIMFARPGEVLYESLFKDNPADKKQYCAMMQYVAFLTIFNVQKQQGAARFRLWNMTLIIQNIQSRI